MFLYVPRKQNISKYMYKTNINNITLKKKKYNLW